MHGFPSTQDALFLLKGSDCKVRYGMQEEADLHLRSWTLTSLDITNVPSNKQFQFRPCVLGLCVCVASRVV